MYVISFPCALYFGKFENVCDQLSFVVVFPLTTCSLSLSPPFKMYLIDAGLLLFTFELSSHVFVICASTFSSGTLNLFLMLNPAFIDPVISFS